MPNTPKPPKTISAQLHDALVVSNEKVAENLWRLVFTAPALARQLEPGQFFTIAAPHEPRQLAKIPLSYAAVDTKNGNVETLYSVVGPGTQALAHMEKDDKTQVVGPCGNGWHLPSSNARCLLVTGGCGVPSILSAAHALGANNYVYDCVLAARTSRHLYGEEELAQAGCAKIHLATDDGSAGEKANAADVTRHLLEQTTYDCILSCGPPAMMDAMGKLALEKGVPCQLSLERRMTCGFGACATCAVATKDGMKGACVDGPVFDAEQLIW